MFSYELYFWFSEIQYQSFFSSKWLFPGSQLFWWLLYRSRRWCFDSLSSTFKYKSKNQHVIFSWKWWNLAILAPFRKSGPRNDQYSIAPSAHFTPGRIFHQIWSYGKEVQNPRSSFQLYCLTCSLPPVCHGNQLIASLYESEVGGCVQTGRS